MRPIILLFLTIAIITAAAIWSERAAVRTAIERVQAYQTDCLLPEGCE